MGRPGVKSRYWFFLECVAFATKQATANSASSDYHEAICFFNLKKLTKKIIDKNAGARFSGRFQFHPDGIGGEGGMGKD